MISPASPNEFTGDEGPAKAGRPAFVNGVASSGRPEGSSPVDSSDYKTWRRITIEEQIRALDSQLRGYAQAVKEVPAKRKPYVEGRLSVAQSMRDHLCELWVAEAPQPPVITGQLDLLGGVA